MLKTFVEKLVSRLMFGLEISQSLKMDKPPRISFFDSIRNLIPFTKEYRRATNVVRELENWNIINEENRKADVIQGLVKEGAHEDALLLLKKDLDHFDLTFFNKLKSKRDISIKVKDKEHDELLKLIGKRPPTPKVICSWVTRFCGAYYKCENECNISQTRCCFHVKYCCNANAYHSNKIRIQIPNEYGLCNECYASKFSALPTPIRFNRIPGVARVVRTGKDKKNYEKIHIQK